ncbi:MAG: peptidylglycine alpha-amidating monooxygenase [Trebouxia sp. A1-2]|nr:MAG: peptidylglycine alpha-amidating monooxygenase [Trebouxia sp. A1-2]
MTASDRPLISQGNKLCIFVLLCLALLGQIACQEGIYVDAVVPAEHEVLGEDQYVCFRVDLPKQSLKIVGVDPLSTQDVVHHMLLFGVGYGVGPGSAMQSLVLQVHYLQERPAGDQSGIRLRMTSKSTPFSAGMINYASYFTIPPGKPKHPIENQCCYSGFEILKGFAFRVHTHALGRSVNLERIEQQNGKQVSKELCERDPQLPQGFAPLKDNILIRPGDTLKATCMFDSSAVHNPVNAGATHNDEMCNLYLMLYSQLPFFMACYGSPQVDRHGMGGIPPAGRVELDLHASWQPPSALGVSPPGSKSAGPIAFGQVSAVAKGHNSDIWVFQRGDVVWTMQTFRSEDKGQHIADPTAFVQAPAVVQLDQDTGDVLSSWGENLFLMPHGLTVDFEGNVWVTDVGLHQAIKFDQQGNQLLVLGKRLEPGSDSVHLCKPTHVAVANDGTIFVADGYCNSRVVRYSATGNFEAEYRLPRGEMDIPHSLVLDECSDALYVADREHSEVHKFVISDQRLQGTWNLKQSGYVYSHHSRTLRHYPGVVLGPQGGPPPGGSQPRPPLCRRNRSVSMQSWSYMAYPNGCQREVTFLPRLKPYPVKGALALVGGGPEETWRLEGVGAPHDIALAASPMPVQGTGERTLAVFVAETKPAGSMLRKFLFVPQGTSMADMVEAGVMEADQSAELIPGGHGVEAHLAYAHQVSKDAPQPLKSNEAHNSVGIVASHKLHMPTTLDPLSGDPALTLPGHVLHQNHQVTSGTVASDQDHAGSVDDLALKHEQTVHKGLIQSDIPASDASDMIIKEEQRKLRSQIPVSPGGIVGHHAAAQPQSAGFGTAVSQLSSFGMPFAGLFAVAAVVLWKRLGDLQPLTAHGSQFAA